MTTQDIVLAFRGWVYGARNREQTYECFAEWIATEAGPEAVDAVNRCGPMQFFNDFVVAT